jgi:predicted metallopeptidase
MQFNTGVILENISRKFKFLSNVSRITATLHEDLCTLMIIRRSVLLRMRSVRDKTVGKIKTYIFGSILFFFENRAVYGIMWENMAEPDSP